MIKEILLTNWKSFSNARLFIDPVTVLIGANASGKSNTLDALLFLQRIASGVSLTEALAGNSHLPGLRGGLEWATNKRADHFILSVLISGEDERTDYLYQIKARTDVNQCTIVSESLWSRKYGFGKRNTPPDKRLLFWTKPNDDLKSQISVSTYNGKRLNAFYFQRSNYTILSQLRQQILNEEVTEGIARVGSALRDIFILDPIPANMRGFSALSDTLNADASNIAGVIAHLPTIKSEMIKTAVDQYLRHLPERDILRIWAESVGRFQSDAMLYCEEQWQEGQSIVEMVDARGMSDGTLRFLAILTALVTRSAGTLLVIEEVDNGLHPSRADLLVGMLKEMGGSRGVDVLVTTHNPALLDALGPEMIPCVTVSHRDMQTGYSQLTLLEDVNLLPKLLSMGSVGRLSSSGRLEQALSGRDGE